MLVLLYSCFRETAEAHKDKQPKEKTNKFYFEGDVVMDSNIVKGMLIVIVILYIISPVDLMPGPIDDAIALILGIAAQKVVK